MRLLQVKHKEYVKFFLSSTLLTISVGQVMALEESRLWLPGKYQHYYLPLKKSALAAESLDRCTKVLEGTLDREQSKPNHPIFRILCMQSTGRNYNEMVDGLTFETLTTFIPAEVAPTQEEHEAKKKARFGLCEQALKQKTKFMSGLKSHYEGYIEPISYDTVEAVFHFDFDATNPSGEVLEYRAYCASDAESPPKIRIKKRPKPELEE